MTRDSDDGRRDLICICGACARRRGPAGGPRRSANRIAIIAVIASFVGAWLAAQLAFSRFAREKIWERKAAAYTAIFEALHYIGRWYEKHYEAMLIRKDIEDEKKAQIRAEANKAEEELERRLGCETWLIPPECRARLEKMTLDLKNSGFKNNKNNDYDGFLDEGAFIVKTAAEEFRLMVVDDLKLNRKWYQKLF
jgi:hypothetical protein